MMIIKAIKKYHRLVSGTLIIACGVWFAQCREDVGGTDVGSSEAVTELQSEVLVRLAENAIVPTLSEFVDRARSLEQMARNYATSLDAVDREDAQAAWREAMLTWQRAEVMQLGPTAVLRYEIYSWPLTNPCRVDQETVERIYTDVDAYAQEPVNVRGLDALEYLLFNNDLGNACTLNSSINSDGDWAALDADEIVLRRAEHAAAVAEVLRRSAEGLLTAWGPGGGDFANELALAGGGAVLYDTAQEALNLVSDAMFYLDTQTKDEKLAAPVGLGDDCDSQTCSDALESPRSGVSLENIAANLRGFQLLFHGGEADGDGPGFDDLLRERDVAWLADDMTDRIAEAIVAVEAVDGPLRDTLDAEREAVVAAFNAVRALTDLLKGPFIVALTLDVPAEGGGDSD